MVYGVDISTLTTFKIGGPAKELIEVSTSGELVEAVAEADGRGLPVLIIAGGSNLLVSDEGFDGRVVRIATRGIEYLDNGLVRAQAGEPWASFVAEMVAAGFSGIECLAGIPGSVGATPVQNVGAYGQDVAGIVESVSTYSRTNGKVRELSAAECCFEYRNSIFKGSEDHVVTSVCFRLASDRLSMPIRYGELARKLGVAQGERVPAQEAHDGVLELRRSKGMVLDPNDPDTNSAGSFFTNPIVESSVFGAIPGDPPGWPESNGHIKVSAAWLIEHAGFAKGYGNDRVSLSNKHTLALTNRGSARAVDVLALASELRDGVHNCFGIDLRPEPLLIGLTF